MSATGFIALTLLVAGLLFIGLSKIADTAIADSKSRVAFKLRTGLVLSGWLAYITVLSLRGVFTVGTLPPRVPVLLVFPAFAFTVFFFVSGKFSKIITHVPAKWPVYFQSFRIIVELLLVSLALKNMVPREATFEGYNFDIIIGISAPLVGWLAFRGAKTNKPLLLLWNIAGFITLSVVVFVFISRAYFPAVWHRQDSILNTGFGLFPYTFLAGFLMPVAVFMHILSLVTMKKSTSAKQPKKS